MKTAQYKQKRTKHTKKTSKKIIKKKQSKGSKHSQKDALYSTYWKGFRDGAQSYKEFLALISALKKTHGEETHDRTKPTTNKRRSNRNKKRQTKLA